MGVRDRRKDVLKMKKCRQSDVTDMRVKSAMENDTQSLNWTERHQV